MLLSAEEDVSGKNFGQNELSIQGQMLERLARESLFEL
jgi:hypothetical protein